MPFAVRWWQGKQRCGQRCAGSVLLLQGFSLHLEKGWGTKGSCCRASACSEPSLLVWCVLHLTSGQGAVLCAPLPLIPCWPWAGRSRWEQAASMPWGPHQPQEWGRANAAPQIAAAGWVWDRWILVPVWDWAAVPTASSAGSCQCAAQRSWAAREGATARTRAGGGRKGSVCSQPWKAFLGDVRMRL